MRNIDFITDEMLDEIDSTSHVLTIIGEATTELSDTDYKHTCYY